MATGRPAGRPPKPTAVKIAEGNPGKRKLNRNVVEKSMEGVPEAPPGLGLDGLRTWAQVWTAGASYLNAEQDYMLIEQLCFAVDELTFLRRSLSVGEAAGGVPRIYKLPNGTLVSHPYINQVKDLRTQITAWLHALGFSPTDRARLNIAETKADDPFSLFNKGRAANKAAMNEGN